MEEFTLFDGKVCTICGQWLTWDRFQKASGYADGIRSSCKGCNYKWKKKSERRVRENDPEKHEQRKAHNRKYHRAYYAEHSDHIRTNANQKRKNRYYADIERYRAEGLYWANVRKARKVINGGSHTHQQWIDLCAKYGQKCLRCGAQKPLAKDHIVPLKLGGSNDISNIQPLCRKCNGWKEARYIIDFRPEAQERGQLILFPAFHSD